MGSYPASRVQVDDVVQVKGCKGPVAEEALPDHEGSLNIVFVCGRHARRELLVVRPAQLVNVVMRAPKAIPA